MSFRPKPTNYFTPEELLSNGYVDLGAVGVGQKVILYDSSGNEVVSATSVPSAITSSTKTVTNSGTAVTLGSSASCKKIWIIALSTNTGIIYVGGSTVLAASKNGFPLQAGDSQTFDISDISKVYIDSTVSGEGVAFVYVS